MNIRQVLAGQVRARMAMKPDLDTQTKLSKAAGITQSTVWRILDCQVGASIDIVEKLAKAFGVIPTALLADTDQSHLLDAWGKLGKDDRDKVLAFMSVTISARPSNIPASQKTTISWVDEQAVPAHLLAASTRASTRTATMGLPENARSTSTLKRKRSQSS